MNVSAYLWDIARSGKQCGMPILSFPAVQHLNASVQQLTSDSQLHAQAMKIVADRTPSAASVSLMDLSVEAEAFGAQVRFAENEVPTIVGQLVSDLESAEKLEVPAVGSGRTGVFVDAIRQAKALIQDRPVLAGCIGPYSLSGRLMDVTEIMYLCYDDPDAVHCVLEKATEFLIAYCKAFKEAGADGVVIAEPLAGLLSPDLNAEFSCSYLKKAIAELRSDDFCVIYHNCGDAVVSLLTDIFALNASAYHFGNAVSMKDVLEKAPADALCMGNIDPAGEFAHGTPESIYQATSALLSTCGSHTNFLISSGCDIPPHAKWENIDAFFRAIGDYNDKAV